MFTSTHRIMTGFLGLLLLLTAGCKRCQESPEVPFTTFVEQEWRLVETSDQAASENLNCFTFMIFVLNRNFKGEIRPVINNEELEEQAITFDYRVFAEEKVIEITSLSQSSGENVQYYQYDLGRDFTLTNTETGNFYRYVPFQGILDPDIDCNSCTF